MFGELIRPMSAEEEKYFVQWLVEVKGLVVSQANLAYFGSLHPLSQKIFLDQMFFGWDSQKETYIAKKKALEAKRIQAETLMDNYSNEALEMNLTITAFLRARDKYKEAANVIQNPDAKALASKLASISQQLAEAVKKAGR